MKVILASVVVLFLFSPLFAQFSTGTIQLESVVVKRIETSFVQDTGKLWRIETVDDNEYVGVILERNETVIRMRTMSLGIINIPIRNIREMEEIREEDIREGEFWRRNLQSTRYFFGPTGHGLQRREGYYQNVWIFFNQMTWGISENFSFGVGLVPTFLFGASDIPIWITPKFSFPIVEEQFNIGAGAFIGTVLGSDNDFGAFGIAYGVATLGGRNNNVSFGLGYGFADGNWGKVPTISLSGMARTGKRGYFLTENYLIGAGDYTLGLFSLGGRTVYRKVSLDYGLIIPFAEDIDGFAAIPWLGLVIPFGKRELIENNKIEE